MPLIIIKPFKLNNLILYLIKINVINKVSRIIINAFVTFDKSTF